MASYTVGTYKPIREEPGGARNDCAPESAGGGEDGGETRYDSLGVFGIDRRKYRRIALDEPAVLEWEGRHEGPCDVSRGGAGVIVPVAPAVGSRVEITLPQDAGEAEGLALLGDVVRAQGIVEPVERGGSMLPTFHCFTCGWTGFFDPITNELATTVRRHSDSTFGGLSRVRGEGGVGHPEHCPICGATSPVHVTHALHRIGIRLDGVDARRAERLAQYVERAVERTQDLASSRREHERVLAEYVPVRVDCAFDSPAQLAEAYLSDISKGGLGISTARELPLGSEIRVGIRPPGAADGFVLPAQIVSRRAQDGGWRYGARFLRFDEGVANELRAYLDALTGERVTRRERSEKRLVATRRLGREIWFGIAIGIVLASTAAILIVLRG